MGDPLQKLSLLINLNKVRKACGCEVADVRDRPKGEEGEQTHGVKKLVGYKYFIIKRQTYDTKWTSLYNRYSFCLLFNNSIKYYFEMRSDLYRLLLCPSVSV